MSELGPGRSSGGWGPLEPRPVPGVVATHSSSEPSPFKHRAPLPNGTSCHQRRKGKPRLPRARQVLLQLRQLVAIRLGANGVAAQRPPARDDVERAAHDEVNEDGGKCINVWSI